ncbi:hypothetical protein CDD83_6362 [Cordyceps sp. RAO-2017]|nr:hypothetical protein CDD83_6362 [Cordyceps sp. RAO-2017]
MLPLLPSAALAAALTVVSAAGAEPDDVKVWAAIAYISHGERTPAMSDLQAVLTPEGAQQMWRQGAAFRTRYLTRTGNGTDMAPIQDIAVNAIDNSQLTVLSRTNEWVAAGAMAFMQGLYPPDEEALLVAAGGEDLSHDYTIGANSTDYPMKGYQYPSIRTVSNQDSSSVGLQGDVGCSAWQNEIQTNVEKNESVREKNQDLYQALFSTAPLEGLVPLARATYANALDIYDLVSYMHAHNGTVFRGLANAGATVDTLRTLAFASERDKIARNDTKAGDPRAVLYSIAGRTLANQVVGQLTRTVAAVDGRGKLTLLFGSHRPLLSFLSIGGLLTRENLASGPMSRLPGPGAAIVFELVSDSGSGEAFPAASDLRVRFYYRATAGANETFAAYSLFGSGFGGTTIPYTSFVRGMTERATTATEWCRVCHVGAAAPWCVAKSSAKPRLSPVLGGVIGAVLTAALIGLVAVVCVTLRRRRAGRSDGAGARQSWYGFRGPQRRAADADVSTSKAGVREARTGSWEMRQGGRGDAPHSDTVGMISRDFDGASRRVEDEDSVSLTGAPVKARESV